MAKHWLARPRTIRMLWVAFGIVLALTLAAELFVPHEAHFGYDGVFGFAAWYGFLACVALILVAKVLGLALKRPDDYYADRDADD
jgi:hypothetical protein